MLTTEIRGFLVSALVKKGMYEFEAEVVADRLLDAEQIGRPEEGCLSLLRYVKAIDLGDIDPRAILLQKSETPATAYLNANESMGQLAGTRGMEAAIAKAEAVGVGLVVIGNSQSLGAPLVYARLAALRGLIGLCCTSTAEKLAPDNIPGFLGSQPAAFAVPLGEHVLGYEFSFQPGSTAVVPLPTELSTTFGLLHAVCTSGLTGERTPSEKTRGPSLERTEHFLLVINPACFAGTEKFAARLHSLQEYFQQAGLSQESSLLSPPTATTLPAATLTPLQQLAEKLHLPWPASTH